MNFNCVQRTTAASVAVAGTGAAAVTTITVPATVTFAPGGVYDVLISAQVPAGTDGTIVNITNGATVGSVMQRCNGNYARARCLGCRKVLRVQFLGDPAHFLLLGVRG